VSSSGTPSRPGVRRTVAAALASTVVAGLVLAGAATSASAHDDLVATSPAAGSTVTGHPDELTLTFSDTVLDDGSATRVQVTGADGSSELADGAPVVQDSTVTQRLTWPASGDAIREVKVLWRVVSRDGHPVSGEFSFRIAPGTTPTASASASASATSTSSPATLPPSTGSSTAHPKSSGTPPASPAPWIILGALTIAAMAATAYLVVARGRRAEGRGEGPPPDSGDDSGR
jgi:copper resistance protein C